MIMQTRLFIILIISGIVIGQFNCAPRAAKSKKAVTYNEDLSGYRPPDSRTDETEVLENDSNQPDNNPYVPPEHDITRQLDIVLNERVENSPDKPIMIYTIQVYTGRSREEANEIRMKVFDVMPDVDPLLVYNKLRFKVQIGRYFDRVSAYKTFKTLKEYFPGAMLVPETVSVDDLIEERNDE